MAVAFGFVDYTHLWKNRIDEMDRGIVILRDAIQRSVQFHNQQADGYLNQFCQRTTMSKERYEMPGGGTLQPLDEEHGLPRPTVRYEGYDVGYPIQAAGDAFGNNRVVRAMMTVQNANDFTVDTQIKDKNWLVDNILAAVFTRADRTYIDRARLGYAGVGTVTVKGLANNDGTRYITNHGRGVSTDDHYLFQTAAIDPTNNPFPKIYKDLVEHTDTFEGTVDVYVPDNLLGAIEDLPNFVEVRDADVQAGMGERTLNNVPARGIGDRVIGKVDRCWIISMSRLPNNYMLAQLRGRKPLAMREYPAPSLQGLFTEEFSPDGNHMETRFLRIAGFGARDRTAALVYQIGAGSYSPPAEYSAPLAA